MGGGLMSSAILGEAIMGEILLNNSDGNTESIRTRMLDYYPDVLKAILEFQAITNVEGKEFDTLYSEIEDIMNNAYLPTMLEDRVILWEQLLGIVPIEGTTIDDRRETVIARIRGQGKLNTQLISNIVNTFTGGSAISWIKDGVLYVEITPPNNNKQYVFANVEKELKLKVPAHLGFQVSRSYREWCEVMDNYPTWGDINDNFTTWEDVQIMSPFR